MCWVLVLVLVVPLVFVLLRDDPEEMGLRPDGDAPLSDGDQPKPVLPGPLEVAYWRDAFRSTPMWQLCGGYFVCGFSIALVSTHFVPFAIERGFSPATAATAFGLMSGLNVVGVLAVGALSDRWGRKLPLGFVYALRGCAYAALLLVPGYWALWSFAVIMGFSWWATLPLTSSLTAEFYGLKHLGILNGVTFTGHQIELSLSIQLGGLLRDLTGSYALPFAIAGLLLFMASLVSLAIEEKRFSVRYQTPLSPGVLCRLGGKNEIWSSLIATIRASMASSAAWPRPCSAATRWLLRKCSARGRQRRSWEGWTLSNRRPEPPSLRWCLGRTECV